MKQTARQMVVCMVLWGMTAGVAYADLVAHWTLNEMTGDTAADASGNGHDGVLIGGPQWIPGQLGGAVAFDGIDDYIDFGNPQDLPAGTSARSMTAWVTTDDLDSGWVAAAAYGSPAGSQAFGFARNGRLLSGFGYGNDLTVADFFETDTWYHLALTYDGATASLYVNGELLLAEGKTWNLNLSRAHIGRQINDAPEFWHGIVDDVRIYNHALSQKEVQDAMIGTPELSAAPAPEDEAIDVVRDVTLSWTPGQFAVTHDVYVGQVFADVDSADRDTPLDVLVGLDHNTNTLDPGRLDFGKTYYWRVDEVNGAPDYTVFKGNVWRFTVEAFAIPVETITASASTSTPGMEPSKTVDSSGLNALDQHSSQGMDMWFTGITSEPVWIQYEFDKAYTLHEMWVWNSNQLIEVFVGFGAKEVRIETSVDGVTWTPLGDVTQIAQATGSADYTANTMVDLGGTMARYVKLNMVSAYGTTGQFGLSEVRFLAIPATAREPQPTSGTVLDSATVTLSWRAGREATEHQVLLGTDGENLPLLATVAQSSVDSGALDYSTTYYWSVTEVNQAETPTTYAGPVWHFTTPDYAVVDDFESYSGKEGEEIFMTWFDGYGGDDTLGGSTTGHIDGPFVETTLVSPDTGSVQSMPIYFDNDGGFADLDGHTNSPTFSEVVREFDPSQDWQASGIQSVSLSFRGSTGNSGRLYLKINGTKVPYDGADTDIATSVWLPWVVDLSGVGTNLQTVTSLAIGIDGAAGAGVVYIDDIRLYPRAVEYVTPTTPDAAHLVAHYTLDGTPVDASGRGHHGTENGDPVYGAGVVGQAVQLDGFDDFIDFGNPSTWPAAAEARTLCAWGMTSSLEPGWRWLVAYGSDATSQAMFIGINGDSLFGGGYGNDISVPDFWQLDEWSHVALTYDGVTARLYANGREAAATAKTWNLVRARAHIGRQVNDAPEFWQGLVDDVRLYDRALSPDEIAWLAGKTEPIVKPF